jgi:hypothetical protein
VVEHRSFDPACDVAQELERVVVTRACSPRGETDEVGEQQRALLYAATSPGALDQRVPDLQSAETELLRGGWLFVEESIGDTSECSRAFPAGDGQRIAEARITRQRAA